MADITMCKGTGCKQASGCIRATAPPSERQSWAMFYEAPRNRKGECEYFWSESIVASVLLESPSQGDKSD
jgi:hypothetical protein